MSERVQNRVLSQACLEGGQGGEILHHANAWRGRLGALVAPALAVAISLSPRPINAAGQAQVTPSTQKSNDGFDGLNELPSAVTYASETRGFLGQSLLAEDAAKTNNNPEAYAAPPASQNVNDHCDIPRGKEGAGFKGQMVDGVLQPGHNFRYRAYAIAHGGKMYLCFDFPAEKGHANGHWVAKLLGPEKMWSTGTKEVTSRNLNNCPDVNPCS